MYLSRQKPWVVYTAAEQGYKQPRVVYKISKIKNIRVTPIWREIDPTVGLDCWDQGEWYTQTFGIDKRGRKVFCCTHLNWIYMHSVL